MHSQSSAELSMVKFWGLQPIFHQPPRLFHPRKVLGSKSSVLVLAVLLRLSFAFSLSLHIPQVLSSPSSISHPDSFLLDTFPVPHSTFSNHMLFPLRFHDKVWDIPHSCCSLSAVFEWFFSYGDEHRKWMLPHCLKLSALGQRSRK